MTAAPRGAAVAGIHHVKIAVADLDAALAWYGRVFHATHDSSLDHHDTEGVTFASIVNIPGVPVPVELRWAPKAARALRECAVMILTVDGDDGMRGWVDHLDACGAYHSPVLTGPGGSVLVIVDPDGKYIRLMTNPPGGSATHDLAKQRFDPRGPWLNPTSMQHPRVTRQRDKPIEGTPV